MYLLNPSTCFPKGLAAVVLPGADRGEAYLAEQIAAVLSQLSEAIQRNKETLSTNIVAEKGTNMLVEYRW